MIADTFLLLFLNVGLPLLLLFAIYSFLRRRLLKRMQAKARIPKEYFALIFLFSAVCSFSAWLIGAFLIFSGSQ
jgi:hypothetical protein